MYVSVIDYFICSYIYREMYVSIGYCMLPYVGFTFF